jgi:hypothetical protein
MSEPPYGTCLAERHHYDVDFKAKRGIFWCTRLSRIEEKQDEFRAGCALRSMERMMASPDKAQKFLCIWSEGSGGARGARKGSLE